MSGISRELTTPSQPISNVPITTNSPTSPIDPITATTLNAWNDEMHVLQPMHSNLNFFASLPSSEDSSVLTSLFSSALVGNNGMSVAAPQQIIPFPPPPPPSFLGSVEFSSAIPLPPSRFDLSFSTNRENGEVFSLSDLPPEFFDSPPLSDWEIEGLSLKRPNNDSKRDDRSVKRFKVEVKEEKVDISEKEGDFVRKLIIWQDESPQLHGNAPLLCQELTPVQQKRLMARSEYFKNLFTFGVESEQKEISLPALENLDLEVLKYMINSAISDQPMGKEIDFEEAKKIYAVALAYGFKHYMEEIKTQCLKVYEESILSKQLNISDRLKFFRFCIEIINPDSPDYLKDLKVLYEIGLKYPDFFYLVERDKAENSKNLNIMLQFMEKNRARNLVEHYSVSLNGDVDKNNDEIENIGYWCPKLSSLTITGCTFVLNQGHIVRRNAFCFSKIFLTLKKLDLSEASGVYDPVTIAKKCAELEEIRLNWDKVIPDEEGEEIEFDTKLFESIEHLKKLILVQSGKPDSIYVREDSCKPFELVQSM